MAGFNSVFSGEPGEDPLEYLEDLSWWASDYLVGKESDIKEIAERSAFRAGLRGSARSDWYNKLSSKDREWPGVKTLFVEEFKLETEIDEQYVSDQVRNFRREAGEDIMSFINRADILVKSCNAEQAKEIRNCIYYRLGDSQADVLLRGFANMRLSVMNEANIHGRLNPSCTYKTVSDAVKGAAGGMGINTMPVRTHNARYNAGSADDRGSDREFREATVQAMKMITDELKLARESTSTSRSGPSSFGQGPYRTTDTTPDSRAGPGPFGQASYTGRSDSDNQFWHNEHSSRGGYNSRGRGGSFARPPRKAGVVCYNCLEPHYQNVCPHPLRPKSERDTIAQCVETGRAIPPELSKKPMMSGAQSNTWGSVSYGGQATTSNTQPSGDIDSTSRHDMSTPSNMVRVRRATTTETAAPVLVGAEESSKRRKQAAAQDDDVVMLEEDQTTPGVTRAGTPRAGQNLEYEKQVLRDMSERLEGQLRTGKSEPAPIRAMLKPGTKRWDIGEFLHQTPVTLSLAQFLDRSPEIRRQFSKYSALVTRRRAKGVKRSKRPRSLAARVRPSGHVDVGEPASMAIGISLGYIMGRVGEKKVEALIDGGSLANLISPQCVVRCGLKPEKLKAQYELITADDHSAPITHSVVVPFVAGGVLCYIEAYVTGEAKSYDLLLSRVWLFCVRAKIDYRLNVLAVTGVNGHKASITITKRGLSQTIEELSDGESESGATSSEANSDCDSNSGSEVDDSGGESEELLTLLESEQAGLRKSYEASLKA